jgi:DNA-binding NarL/FixJ family response regulator
MFLSMPINQPPDPGSVLAPQNDDLPSGEQAPGSSRSLRTGAPQRVLIVEDEALIAMDMTLALSQAGFEVLGTVDTEADAVDASKRLQPDVIMMDITLREGSGISAARAIMGSSAALVIFVSGNSDPQTLHAVGALGAAAFIRKPFAGGELPQLVANALATRRSAG